MQTSLAGKIEIIGHEGICLTKYLDSKGVWTIGAGATKTEIPDLASWPMDKKIPLPDVIKFFDIWVKRYENAVNKALKVTITQQQFDALVSICYNIGVSGMANSTFMRLINARAPMGDIVNAILKWRKPPEIIPRRKREARLYSTQKYQHGGKCLVFPVSAKGTPLYSKGYEIDVEKYMTDTQ